MQDFFHHLQYPFRSFQKADIQVLFDPDMSCMPWVPGSQTWQVQHDELRSASLQVGAPDGRAVMRRRGWLKAPIRGGDPFYFLKLTYMQLMMCTVYMFADREHVRRMLPLEAWDWSSPRRINTCVFECGGFRMTSIIWNYLSISEMH